MPPRAAFAQARCEPFRLLNFSADAVKEKDRRTPTAIESTVRRTLLVLSALGLDRRRALRLLDALARDELVAQFHLLRDAVNVLRLLPALGASQNLARLQKLGAVFLVNPDV